jgi:hypothetical protein
MICSVYCSQRSLFLGEPHCLPHPQSGRAQGRRHADARVSPSSAYAHVLPALPSTTSYLVRRTTPRGSSADASTACNAPALPTMHNVQCVVRFVLRSGPTHGGGGGGHNDAAPSGLAAAAPSPHVCPSSHRASFTASRAPCKHFGRRQRNPV